MKASFKEIANPGSPLTQGVFHRDGFSAAIALGGGSLLTVDGGSTFNITVPGALPRRFIYQCTERQDSETSILLLNAVREGSGKIVILFAHRIHNQESSGHPPTPALTLAPNFHIICASINSETAGHPLAIIWSRKAATIPVASWYYPTKDTWLLLGGSSYNPYEPHAEENKDVSDDVVPIPRAGEQLDALPGSTVDSPAPLPYSWTQTSDSVTIAFGLPSDTRASSIRLILASKDLSLLVSAPIPGFPLPRYTKKAWWAPIDASGSFWTWDKEGERQTNEENPSVGLLTLHLEKVHEGTRWPHIFESTGTNSMDPVDIEVPETLDPSEMWHIREALEKYTNSMTDGGDQSRGGLGAGLPSLSQGEYDEEVDATSGTPITLSWVSASEDEKKTILGSTLENEASLLSLPLPLSRDKEPSFVVKNDVDGLLYTSQDQNGDKSQMSFEHVATFPALAFVLASKRDLRYVFHISSKVVLAFEGSTGVGFGENVYIYKAAKQRTSRTADQAVLKIGGGSAGTLVGACGIQRKGGRVDLVCLCENELVVVNDIC